MSDPAVAQGIGLRREVTLASTVDWIQTAASDPGRDALAIVAGDRHVGNVVLDQFDDFLGTARVSIYIGEPDARGQGFGLQALECVIERARERRLYKLWLTVHSENERARALYRRAGFEEEGTLRGEFLLEGRRIDAIRMGLILDP